MHERRPELSKGQNSLLLLISHCTLNNQPLLFDNLIHIYYKNVKKIVEYPAIEFDRRGQKKLGRGEYDIMECYNNQNCVWFTKIKPLIKSWFVSAIGLLVIKGWLRVLPVINID